MELRALLPLIPEIRETPFVHGRLELFWQGWKDVTPFRVTVPAQLCLGEFGLAENPPGMGTGRCPWAREGLQVGTGRGGTDRCPFSPRLSEGLCVSADNPEYPSQQAAALQPRVRCCPGVHFSHGEPPE